VFYHLKGNNFVAVGLSHGGKGCH